MQFLLFGRSGLRVSELCLGTMTFGTDWGWGADADECGGILRAFAQAGRDPATLRWPEDAVPERVRAIVDMVGAVADEHGATRSQVAIAWLRQRPSPPTLIPILGVRSVDQLRDDLGALDVRLTPDDHARLDEVSRPRLGFPRAFLESDNVRDLIYGETWGRLAV